jgi:hypothetical protein
MNLTADSVEFVGRAVASDDLDLVHAIQSGDVSAFDQLVWRYDLRLIQKWLNAGVLEDGKRFLLYFLAATAENFSPNMGSPLFDCCSVASS